MQLYGNPMQNIEASLERVNEGLDEIKEGISMLDSYDMELVLESVDEYTREDILRAVELINSGVNAING